MEAKPAPVALDDFARSHGLQLDVEFRETCGDFTAFFYGVEVKRDCFLIGEYGYGKTPLQAKRSYAERISGKRLVVDAMGPSRREFTAPRLAVPPKARRIAKRRSRTP